MSDTGFDEMPADTARLMHEFARDGLVNIVGGCCGTTPEHVEAIGRSVSSCAPRRSCSSCPERGRLPSRALHPGDPAPCRVFPACDLHPASHTQSAISIADPIPRGYSSHG